MILDVCMRCWLGELHPVYANERFDKLVRRYNRRYP